MNDELVLGYLFLFSISFGIGALTAKNKRGRHLDKPIYDFVPTAITKIVVSIMGVIVYLYLVSLKYNDLDKKLLWILIITIILVIIYATVLALKIRYKSKKKTTDEPSNDNISDKVMKNDENIIQNNSKIDSSLNDNINEIISILATAISNGYFGVDILFTIIIIIVKCVMLLEKSLESYFNMATFADVYILMLFNNVFFLVFSVLKFYRYYQKNQKSQKNDEKDDYYSIEAYLKNDVDN